MIKEVDLTNKVILDIDKYIEIKEEKKDILNEMIRYQDRYFNLIKYLISECTVSKYTNGKKYLEYDKYNNHLAEYIKEIEPELYNEKLEDSIDDE